MRRVYLCHCSPGDILEDVFVLTGKQFSASSTGKYFIKCFVSDKTQQMTARMWNATRDIFNALPESGFVKLRGRVENYQNNLQFIIEQIWPAKEGMFEIAELIPPTTREPLHGRPITNQRSQATPPANAQAEHQVLSTHALQLQSIAGPAQASPARPQNHRAHPFCPTTTSP
jgi:RecG-like helicase